ncbi:MAG: 30S ribosomal protein S18 [Elusimicrobiales bacterium]
MEQTNTPKENTNQPARRQGYGRKPLPKKKQCRFCIEKIKEIDWRQPQLLKMFTTDTGRIIPRKITGVCAKHQRQLARAIKINRNLGLMPYTTMMRK